ncbi:MAG: hypothetical protein ABW292_04910 [Vicinamibacterales bacterium]
MQRLLFTAILVLACSSAAVADVRVDEKTQLKFAGAMGQVVNLFGGGATRNGVVRTVAVKGDRKATRSDSNGQIVDLREEKVYDIDFKDKSYKVTTFAEIRRQLEEARQKAAQQAPQQAPPDAGAPAADAKEPQVEIDFSMKESGQKREINGFDAREVVMTIAVREKGKTLEQSGGMVMTSNIWLTPKIAAMDEVVAFDLRYAQQINVVAMFDAQQTAALMTMYPMMKPAIDRFEKESVNMDGTSVLTVATLDVVASAEQAAEQAKEQQGQSSAAQAPPTSLGGLGGALGGRIGRRILSGGNKNADTAPAASTPGRATIMTMTDEVVKVTPSVSETDVAIPAGFKQKS